VFGPGIQTGKTQSHPNPSYWAFQGITSFLIILFTAIFKYRFNIIYVDKMDKGAFPPKVFKTKSEYNTALQNMSSKTAKCNKMQDHKARSQCPVKLNQQTYLQIKKLHQKILHSHQ
jgi:hypothetical protein